PPDFFFFSSRRRHTRFSRDWSSDVCSSDLDQRRGRAGHGGRERRTRAVAAEPPARPEQGGADEQAAVHVTPGGQRPRGPEHRRRSEERRVGKECTTRRATSNEK